MDRRTFLAGVGATLAGAAAAGCGGPTVSRGAPRGRRAAAGIRTGEIPTSRLIIEENARPGSPGWVIGRHTPNPSGIEGYANRVSAQRGDEVVLYVNTVARSFKADVFRMGYYQGFGARHVLQTPTVRSQRQPPHSLTPGTNMVECHWHPSVRFVVGDDWVSGNYLIRLLGDGLERRYIPLTVRDDASHAAIVVQSSVTTWQAYNLWGGYSLYGGIPRGGQSEYDSRSRVVSFDRPYGHPPLDAHGSGDWLGNEFPFVFLAERHGLDVTYWTDVDLDLRPELLANHRVLVSLGHDEYWSWRMRYAGAEQALEHGVNLAFLGANACYRHIRFASSPLGANRRVVCYKDASDPHHANPVLTTQNWSEGLFPRPESQFIGSMYRSFQPNAQRHPLVVADASSWIYAGTGLRPGSRLPYVVGSEFDTFVSPPHGPGNVEILGHSPTPSVTGPGYSDLTYYTRTGGGGVFATGTANWVTLLWSAGRELERRIGFGSLAVAEPLGRITLNVLGVLANGPAAAARPAEANWRSIYPNAAPLRPSVDVSGH